MAPLSWLKVTRPRRSPSTPLGVLLVTALIQNTFSVGYNLYVGLTPLHPPTLVHDAMIWMALTGLAFGVATLCIPLIKLAHRLGFMRQTHWTSWLAFYGTVLATCMAGGTIRMLLGQWLLPGLPGPVLSTGIATSVGWNMALMLVTAEWYRGHLETLKGNARARERFAAELLLTQKEMVSGEDRHRRELAEFLHGPVQTHLFLAWVQLKAAQNATIDWQVALNEASALLGVTGKADFAQVRRELCEGPAPDTLGQGSTRLAESYAVAVPTELLWSPEASALARRLAPEDQAMLLQLEEECMLNALRHGAPRHIQLIAEQSGDDTLRLAIKDDGKGIADLTWPSGLGLKLLCQKLEARGGSWDILSRPGAGTEVRMELSIPRSVP